MRAMVRLVAGILLTPAIAKAQEATPPGTPAPVHDECVAVEPELVEWISQGLYEDDGTSLSNVWAVRSDTFPNASVWFVAADIDGPGMEGESEIALWATLAINEDGTEQDDSGLVLSVDAMAQEFSDWFDGEQTDLKVYSDDDGAEEAEDCALGKE